MVCVVVGDHPHHADVTFGHHDWTSFPRGGRGGHHPPPHGHPQQHGGRGHSQQHGRHPSQPQQHPHGQGQHALTNGRPQQGHNVAHPRPQQLSTKSSGKNQGTDTHQIRIKRDASEKDKGGSGEDKAERDKGESGKWDSGSTRKGGEGEKAATDEPEAEGSIGADCTSGLLLVTASHRRALLGNFL